jgi:high-affinity nickel permease
MNQLIKLLPFIQFGFFIKIGFSAVALFFVLFLLIAARQVFAMNKIIDNTNGSSFIKVSAIVLLIIGISLFLTALVIL